MRERVAGPLPRSTFILLTLPPPLLLRRSGTVEMIGEGGLPIGVMRGASFDEVAFDFVVGDRLLVYSDGLTEAENPAGEPFTEERLLDLVRQHLHVPTGDLLSEVTRAVQVWRGSASVQDDMSLLVLEGVDGMDEAWQIAAE